MREVVHRYAGALPGPRGRERFKNMFKPKITAADVPPPPPAAVTNPTPPPTMPDFNSPAALEARRKTIAAAGGAGRASTILTTPQSRGAGTIAGGVQLGGG